MKINFWIIKVAETKFIKPEKKELELPLEEDLRYQLSEGDKVFIWHETTDKEGVIAKGKVITNSTNSDSDKVTFLIEEYRLSEIQNMLMSYDLKEIPEGNNLDIFKNQNQNKTNYQLDKTEYKRISKLWKNPERVKDRLLLSPLEKRIEKHLYLYKNYLNNNPLDVESIKETQAFFKQFKEKSHSETIEWEDVKELGDHLLAFKSEETKNRALNKQVDEEEIKLYRETFKYLFDKEKLADKKLIDYFDPPNKLKLDGFGIISITEIIGHVFPEEYFFFNQQYKEAVTDILKIDLNYEQIGEKTEDEVNEYKELQTKIKAAGIVKKYQEIVGQVTDLPINLEINQFLNYLYENYKQGRIEKIEEPNYWILSIDENIDLWHELQEENQIAIGSDILKDIEFNQIDEKITVNLQDDYHENQLLINYEFRKEMQLNDHIIVRYGEDTILGIGRITGEYKYDSTAKSHKTRRGVRWLKTGKWEFPDEFSGKGLLKETEVDELLIILKSDPIDSYEEKDFFKEMFMSTEKAEEIIESLDYKKNIILQGPPGVGKTFAAKKIAYLHMKEAKPEQIEVIQFHQSYSYEDFIRGYKPDGEGFSLKDGVFYNFCEKAKENPSKKYYMIIDEINRGNLSKIFGELMMLIEIDKRGKKHSIKLPYSKTIDETFYIPENIYLIGTMNTADHSLVLMDYALRRRFAFITLKPAFGKEIFDEFLEGKGINSDIRNKMNIEIMNINEAIKADLGSGFEIGHSYFCPTETIDQSEGKNWYNRIKRLEIAPLLREYWFDQEDKVDELLNKIK